jgi:hypothetical protein
MYTGHLARRDVIGSRYAVSKLTVNSFVTGTIVPDNVLSPTSAVAELAVWHSAAGVNIPVTSSAVKIGVRERFIPIPPSGWSSHISGTGVQISDLVRVRWNWTVRIFVSTASQ